MANTSNRSRKSKSSTSSSSANSSRGRNSVPFYNDIISLASSLLRSRQEAGAEKIGSVAEATRNFAGDFEDTPNMQTYINAAADQMDTLSEYVSETSLEDMVSEAAVFAKRYPVATLSFAAAAGFGIIRLVLANNSESDSRRSSRRANSRNTASRSKATKSGKRSSTAGKARGNGRDTAPVTANAA